MKYLRSTFVVLFLVFAFAFVFATTGILNLPPESFVGSKNRAPGGVRCPHWCLRSKLFYSAPCSLSLESCTRIQIPRPHFSSSCSPSIGWFLPWFFITSLAN